jgi:DNA ligase-1
MPDLNDGESVEMQGSGAQPYVIKNTGGVYSCSCPAWRNQSNAIEQRTCKHIRKLRGDVEEEARIGGALPQRPVKTSADGEDVSGPPVLLAESWDNAMDLSGWWISEKLDGVRAYWDGKQFLSRQGNLYHAPDWFIEGLPTEPLDGELWIARKAFQRTVGVVRRQDKTDLWKDVRFLVFDAPALTDPFEDRMKYLSEQFRSWKLPYAEPLSQTLCSSIDHLREELARIESLGGEGLMLRQPGSKYVAGRSTTLYKVKTFHDAEAMVVGYEAGRGKHTGRVGALNVQLPNGKLFSVGTGLSDKERSAPPAVGSTITFRYQELSDAGIPRFPSYVRLFAGSQATSATPAIANPPPTKVAKVAVPKPVDSVSDTGTAVAARRFECTEDGASKFWEVSREGSDLTTRWGKIGTGGQEKTKSFPTDQKAQAEYNKLIEEKTSKGYVEVEQD